MSFFIIPPPPTSIVITVPSPLYPDFCPYPAWSPPLQSFPCLYPQLSWLSLLHSPHLANTPHPHPWAPNPSLLKSNSSPALHLHPRNWMWHGRLLHFSNPFTHLCSQTLKATLASTLAADVLDTCFTKKRKAIRRKVSYALTISSANLPVPAFPPLTGRSFHTVI